MKKIIFVIVASIISYGTVLTADESTISRMESIISMGHNPNLNFDLTFESSGKIYEIKNISKHDFKLLNPQPDDPIEFLEEKANFSGYSIFTVFFPSSGLKMYARGESSPLSIQSIGEMRPNWNSQTVDVALTISGKALELKDISWEDLALLNMQPGDLVTFTEEKVDFSNYGNSFF